MSMNSILSGIFINIVSAILISVLIYFRKAIFKNIFKENKNWFSIAIISVFIYNIIFLLIYLVFFLFEETYTIESLFHINQNRFLTLVFLTLVEIIFLIFITYKTNKKISILERKLISHTEKTNQLQNTINKYKDFGIHDFDFSIKEGFDYKKSLKEVQSDLKFIGVGAGKLTRNVEEFTSMVHRVDNSGNEMQLVLCNPESKSLELLNLRAGLQNDTYKSKVVTSLRLIASLKKKGLKIRVRLYNFNTIEEMPVFRVMLINSEYCLLAYSHFNDPRHEGEELPQLHLKKPENVDQNNLSIFKGFQKYFEQTWNDANLEEWNYKDYI